MPPVGFEPTRFRLRAGCSGQLSYRGEVEHRRRLELPAFCLASRRSNQLSYRCESGPCRTRTYDPTLVRGVLSQLS